MSRPLHSYPSVAAYDPERSPRWRYERAMQLADVRVRRPAMPGRDDSWIRQFRLFMNRWREIEKTSRNRDDMELRREILKHQKPALFFAYQAFLRQTSRTYWTMEARILAGQTNEEIAHSVDTQPDMVEAYAALFFDVRPRLQKRDYICNKVYPQFVADLDGLTIDASARFFGYFGGPVVLDAVLQQFDQYAASRPAAGQSCSDFFNTHFNTGSGRRSAQVVNNFEINRYNVMELFQLHAAMLSDAKKSQGEGDNMNLMEQTVSTYLRTIPWLHGQKLRDAMAGNALKDYYAGSSEPRASELLQFVSPDGPPEIEVLQFPSEAPNPG